MHIHAINSGLTVSPGLHELHYQARTARGGTVEAWHTITFGFLVVSSDYIEIIQSCLPSVIYCVQ